MPEEEQDQKDEVQDPEVATDPEDQTIPPGMDPRTGQISPGTQSAALITPDETPVPPLPEDRDKPTQGQAPADPSEDQG